MNQRADVGNFREAREAQERLMKRRKIGDIITANSYMFSTAVQWTIDAPTWLAAYNNSIKKSIEKGMSASEARGTGYCRG